MATHAVAGFAEFIIVRSVTCDFVELRVLWLLAEIRARFISDCHVDQSVNRFVLEDLDSHVRGKMETCQSDARLALYDGKGNAFAELYMTDAGPVFALYGKDGQMLWHAPP